jgi:hypothetical protein
MLDQWSDKMKTAGQVARNTRNGPEEIQEGPIKLSAGLYPAGTNIGDDNSLGADSGEAVHDLIDIPLFGHGFDQPPTPFCSMGKSWEIRFPG